MAISRPLYGPRPEGERPLRPAGDLAGTRVVDREGRYAGSVYGVLADSGSGLIRYLDLALAGDEKHILVPLGHTRLTRLAGETEIELRAARVRDLQTIPPYEPHEDGPNGDQQRAVLAAHGRLFHGERYYAHPAYDHSGLYAGEHPIIRDSTIIERSAPLQRLSGLRSYQVAQGEDDIRGWPLVDRRGDQMGTLTDLLVDTGAEKVRYALVQVEGPPDTSELSDIPGSSDNPLKPVPVGYLEIERGEELVRTPALDREDLAAIPRYEEEEFDRLTERRVRETLEARLDGDRHFDRPDFRGDDLKG